MIQISGTLLREKNKQAYAMVLTLLWVLVMVSFAFDWQYHRRAFVIANDSRLEIALAITQDTGANSLTILDNIFTSSCLWVADALLVCHGARQSYCIFSNLNY